MKNPIAEENAFPAGTSTDNTDGVNTDLYDLRDSGDNFDVEQAARVLKQLHQVYIGRDFKTVRDEEPDKHIGNAIITIAKQINYYYTGMPKEMTKRIDIKPIKQYLVENNEFNKFREMR